MTKVSVVIPTYNRARVLPRAIDSALAQTVEDLEVVVVDDASDDETREVVEGYEDDRLRYVRHLRNRNGSAARNTGIALAGGEYVAFLDSDDEWHPRKLERQVKCLEERPGEFVAVYCDYAARRYGPTAPLRRFVGNRILGGGTYEYSREGGEELVDDVLTGDFHVGGASTLLVERDAVEAIDGFDESFDRQQDVEFLIRLLREGKVAYVDEKLVVKHKIDYPPGDAVRRSKRRLREKFGEEIECLEAGGHRIRRGHDWKVTEQYCRRGEFRKAVGTLPGPPESKLETLRFGWVVGQGVVYRIRNAFD
ncbi:glycosyl transferase family 2 [Halobacteriales archaeon QS_8_69_26]|nr:MAG: glycosyl transferase family 2 [Halobacteriales archaeon QS_8_69_26]